jgi:ubiquitin C-terminal hydrolase
MRKSAVAMMNERRQTPLYDLCGIIYHYGSLRGGHYTAACLNSNSETNVWYKYNDSSVSRVSDPEQLVTSSAYVLVYKIKDVAKQSLKSLRP